MRPWCLCDIAQGEGSSLYFGKAGVGCKLSEGLGCHCFALLALLVLQLQAKNVLAFFSKEVILQK